MLQIAVCDNDQEELEQLLPMLQDYAAQGRAIVWRSFTDPAALLENLQQGARYDAAVLDILMPEVSGIALGKYLKEKSPATAIIYTTSSHDFALDAYQNHALRYLLKPVQQQDFFSALDMAYSLYEQREEPFLIRSADGVITTTPDRIVLAENIDRMVRYLLADGTTVQTVSRRTRLDDAVAPLPDRPEFIKPHNSFWVNMTYIRAIEKEDLVMDNGLRVPISRSRYKEVKHSYLKFLEATGGAL